MSLFFTRDILMPSLLFTFCLFLFSINSSQAESLTNIQPNSTIKLTNKTTSIFINPASLKTNWLLASHSIPVIDSGLRVENKTQFATAITQLSPSSATWVLSPSGIKINAIFNDVLTLSFSTTANLKIDRNNPIALTWFSLPAKAVNTLLLPFNEGMRIPTNHPTLINYIAKTYSGSNTTQDLKMPFWSAKISNNKELKSADVVSYQMITATNNGLLFSVVDKRLHMQASHEFTPLNRNEHFSVQISLGDSELSGAKQYRQWRQHQKLAVPLSEKRQQQPELERLIGASHVYLFGQDLLAVEDVSDWWGLKNWYFTQDDLLPSKEAIKQLALLKQGKNWFSAYEKRFLIENINSSLNQYFPVKQNNIKNQFDAAQQRKAWLQTQAGAYLINPKRWGQGLSEDMIDTLIEAKLTKLWLGLDNWMPAFYQPNIVDKAKAAGYLIGTYDSYNTAIKKGINDNWLTAQLPDDMRKNCAIENANGKQQKGFRGNGFYLHPSCQLEYVEQRINDIILYGRFNSLFLDVDATAMAREDYSAQRQSNETEMLEAFNHRMSSITKKHNIILGSEDGNGLTTQGIAFAHGMETVGFGWTDKEMKTDRTSPYFLGAWYPDNKPDFFFKSSEVKEPYKTVYFSPKYSIPLYQTVFHDELINSHHWHTASIKFSNVQVERDLTMMLYNTPAMIHLNREESNNTNKQRIKTLQHYQTGFLPIHSVLWNTSLIDFSWLDNSGKVQQTTYNDGSIIIANFSNEDHSLSAGMMIPSQSILAILSNNTKIRWAPQ